MSIESNLGSTGNLPPEERPDEKPAFTGSTAFGGAPSSGGGDIIRMLHRAGVSRIDSTVEPYLTKIRDILKDNLPGGVDMVRATSLSNAYAFLYEGRDGKLRAYGIAFIQATDAPATDFRPASARLSILADEIRDTFKDRNLIFIGGNLVLAGYPEEMNRAEQMANTIALAFNVTSDPQLRDLTFSSFNSTQLVTDFSITNVRDLENQLSPFGTRPRVEVGCTLAIKVRNEQSRDVRDFIEDQYKLGVIGGYTKFREAVPVAREGRTVMMYQPEFHITVCNSALPVEGIGALLISALAPTIYNTKFWATQWRDLAVDGAPNPGALEIDPSTGKPTKLTTNEELLQFIEELMLTPVIVFDFQDGRESIPNFWRMFSPKEDVKNKFMERLTSFLEVDPETTGGAEITRIIGYSYDGVYGFGGGTLHDSRDIDFLRIAAERGAGSVTDSAIRAIMLGGSENPTDQARIVNEVTSGFLPTTLTTHAAINPDFIKWLVNKAESRGITILDPHGQTPVRALSSMLSGFGSTNGIGTIVTNGVTRSPVNFRSMWNG